MHRGRYQQTLQHQYVVMPYGCHIGQIELGTKLISVQVFCNTCFECGCDILNCNDPIHLFIYPLTYFLVLSDNRVFRLTALCMGKKFERPSLQSFSILKMPFPDYSVKTQEFLKGLQIHFRGCCRHNTVNWFYLNA